MPAASVSAPPPAEFEIWYNESFFIPEDMQAALTLGSSVRPGMVPVSRIVSLVSAPNRGGRWEGARGPSLFCPQTCHVWAAPSRSHSCPGRWEATGLCPVTEGGRTDDPLLGGRPVQEQVQGVCDEAGRQARACELPGEL